MAGGDGLIGGVWEQGIYSCNEEVLTLWALDATIMSSKVKMSCGAMGRGVCAGVPWLCRWLKLEGPSIVV